MQNLLQQNPIQWLGAVLVNCMDQSHRSATVTATAPPHPIGSRLREIHSSVLAVQLVASLDRSTLHVFNSVLILLFVKAPKRNSWPLKNESRWRCRPMLLHCFFFWVSFIVVFILSISFFQVGQLRFAPFQLVSSVSNTSVLWCPRTGWGPRRFQTKRDEECCAIASREIGVRVWSHHHRNKAARAASHRSQIW